MNPRRSTAIAWEWMQAGLLAANLAWTTLCLGGFLAGTREVTFALTGALVAVHLLSLAGRPGRFGAHPAGWLLVPFLLYAAANVRWVAPARWLGWTDWLGWAQAIAVFWVVLNGVRAPACRRFLFGAILALALVSSALGCYQHFVRPNWLMLHRVQAQQFVGRSSGSFGIPNSLAGLMLLLLPVAAARAFGRGGSVIARLGAGAALAVLAAGLVLAVSRGAWIALAIACVLWPLLRTGRGLGRRILASVGAAVAAAVLAGALYGALPSLRHRVDQMVRDAGEKTRPIMWRGAWKIFLAHPAFGGGGGSYDILFERYRPEHYLDEPFWAHDEYLNTAADYGAAGFILFFGAVALIAERCRAHARARLGAREPATARSAPGGSGAATDAGAGGFRGNAGPLGLGLLAFAIQACFEFHLKIPALAMIAAALGALAAAEAWPGRPPAARGASAGRRRSDRLRAAASIAGAAAAAAATLLWIMPHFRAEEFRRAAREQIDRMAAEGKGVAGQATLIAAVREHFAHATEIDPGNGQAWSDWAYADSLEALVTPAATAELGKEVEAKARRAIALCPLVAEFWIRDGTGLDMQGRWIEGGASFAHALELAPVRADTWYYQAYHLSLNPQEKDLATAAAAYCLRLDPDYQMAHALIHRLADGSPGRL